MNNKTMEPTEEQRKAWGWRPERKPVKIALDKRQKMWLAGGALVLTGMVVWSYETSFDVRWSREWDAKEAWCQAHPAEQKYVNPQSEFYKVDDPDGIRSWCPDYDPHIRGSRNYVSPPSHPDI